MKKLSGINTRELVLDILVSIEKKEGYSHQLIRDVLDKYNYMEPFEKAFVKRLAEGTVERTIQLDYVIDCFSKTPVSKMKPFIRQVLRMSTYQILYMDSVPDAAVCNEAVKLVQKRKFQNLKGFVNGVLRTIARQKEEIVYPDKEKDFTYYASVRYSMPEWIVKMWVGQFGEAKTESLLASFLETFPVTLRLVTDAKGDVEKELLIEAEKQGISLKQHSLLNYAYQAYNIEGMVAFPGFEEGKVTVQDVSSMLVTECAGIVPGQLVVDVCSAPGGKAMHMAQKLQGTGKVIARDVSEAKVNLITENCRRMRIKNIQAQVWDATVLDEKLIGKADVVLCDVPCSGLGVIGKKRDIKYNLSKELLESLLELQKEIVQTAWQYVKPGGIFLYSTCTIHTKENEDMVEWIQKEFPLKPDSILPFLPKEIKEKTAEEGYLQLLPDVHHTDGFFIARFKREQNGE